MVGGGPGAFIGAVHRMAARLDDRFELVAACLSSDPERSRTAALDLHIAPERAYGNFREMASTEPGKADGIDVVSIVTPNHLHYAVAKAFLEAGINVMCEKPLTTTLQDALDLVEVARRRRLIFGLAHNYTGYPMVRQARQMLAEREIGDVRVVQVEYTQEWLATPIEKTGQKQAVWRTDPLQSGPAGCLGDIGSHAFNLACFVTGLKCQEVAADLSTIVPNRRVDDNVQVLLRFESGARGMLWTSQVAVGNQNNLRLRIYGDRAGIEWSQEEPDCLWFSALGKPPMMIHRSGPAANAAAAHASRLPAGHPEGYIEAFAQLYSDLAEQICARQAARPADSSALLLPDIRDGVEGMRFISAALESSQRNSAWISVT